MTTFLNIPLNLRQTVSAILLFFCLSTGAQTAESEQPRYNADSLCVRYSVYSQWCSPEKLYLHIDRAYYRTGESVWFAAYLTNASKLARFKESNFIYVELLNKAGEAESRVKIKRGQDGFAGCLEIPDYLDGGFYTLRAYTAWQMNNNPEYMFNQTVYISGRASKIKKGAKETARPGTQGAIKKEQKVKAADAADISFYPEGGRYFYDQSAVIAFKAMSSAGMPISVRGVLVNSTGDTLSNVSTVHDGMGKFVLSAQKGDSYFMLTDAGDRYELPPVSENGCSIALVDHKDILYIRALSAQTDDYGLFVRDADKLKPLAMSKLCPRPSFFKLSTEKLSPGINSLLIVNKHGEIESERLFFVYDKDYPAATFRGEVPKKQMARELIQSQVLLKDAEGKPLDGNFSVSVTKASLEEWHQHSGIAAYMNLGSELKGHIENPDQYFDASLPLVSRKLYMDLLMMVQGWRYYNVGTPADGPLTVRHFKEYVQKVTGKIKRSFSSKAPGKFIFTVLIPRLKFTRIVDAQKATTFVIDSLDFEEGTSFIVSATRKNAIFDYVPVWDGEKFAPKYKYMPTLKAGLMSSSFTGSSFDYLEEKHDTLEAAVVTAEMVSIPFADMVPSHDMEFYANRTLIEYLKIKYPLFVYVNGYMYNKRRYSPSVGGNVVNDSEEFEVTDNTPEFDEEFPSKGQVKLVLNDAEEQWWIFENINLEDIASIYVSREPDARFDADGGLVIIKMKSAEAMARNNQSRPSLLCFIPLGYQYPQYFYSPRYDKGNQGDGFDQRSTLYWNPCIKIKGGRATMEFCDSDQLDHPYSVRIEGLTSEGKPFSCRGEL